LVGLVIGLLPGLSVLPPGLEVGPAVGLRVGLAEGLAVGLSDGLTVGLAVMLGGDGQSVVGGVAPPMATKRIGRASAAMVR
jgi:hypothetical protein